MRVFCLCMQLAKCTCLLVNIYRMPAIRSLHHSHSLCPSLCLFKFENVFAIRFESGNNKRGHIPFHTVNKCGTTDKLKKKSRTLLLCRKNKSTRVKTDWRCSYRANWMLLSLAQPLQYRVHKLHIHHFGMVSDIYRNNNCWCNTFSWHLVFHSVDHLHLLALSAVWWRWWRWWYCCRFMSACVCAGPLMLMCKYKCFISIGCLCSHSHPHPIESKPKIIFFCIFLCILFAAWWRCHAGTDSYSNH